MIEQEIGGHKLKLYDSIDELPIVRFHKYNKYLLIDSSIGSDLQDIDGHFNRAIRFIKTKPELAITELENLRQSIHLINEEICPKHMAFAILIAEIDGEPVNDITEAGVMKLLERIGEAKQSWLDRFVESVKKKIDNELSLYFPGKFEDANVKEYYDRLKKRTLLVLGMILRGEKTEDEVQAIDDFLLMMAKPRTFSGSGSVEISYDKQFEDMNLLLSQKLGVRPEEMTVLKYYNAFEYLKKTMKPNGGK